MHTLSYEKSQKTTKNYKEIQKSVRIERNEYMKENDEDNDDQDDRKDNEEYKENDKKVIIRSSNDFHDDTATDEIVNHAIERKRNKSNARRKKEDQRRVLYNRSDKGTISTKPM